MHGEIAEGRSSKAKRRDQKNVKRHTRCWPRFPSAHSPPKQLQLQLQLLLVPLQWKRRRRGVCVLYSCMKKFSFDILRWRLTNVWRHHSPSSYCIGYGGVHVITGTRRKFNQYFRTGHNICNRFNGQIKTEMLVFDDNINSCIQTLAVVVKLTCRLNRLLFIYAICLSSDVKRLL